MKSVSAAVALAIALAPAAAYAWSDPSNGQSFGQAVQSLALKQTNQYTFGTNGNTRTLAQLSQNFSPYGIASTRVINQEWERYQPFNPTNFVMSGNGLQLTATIPSGGGLFPGGIHSGQIATKATYAPGLTGHNVYAIDVKMRIPNGRGTWPAAWLYPKTPGVGVDGSEIDNPEFFVMRNQNQYDWTGYNHGPGMGRQIHSIKTNQWVWSPGTDFSANFHDYQLIWTRDAVYKYVDGRLVFAQAFRWTATRNPPQLIVNLAVGSSNSGGLPGLQPTSRAEFPAVLAVSSITIWGGN